MESNHRVKVLQTFALTTWLRRPDENSVVSHKMCHEKWQLEIRELGRDAEFRNSDLGHNLSVS